VLELVGGVCIYGLRKDGTYKPVRNGQIHELELKRSLFWHIISYPHAFLYMYVMCWRLICEDIAKSSRLLVKACRVGPNSTLTRASQNFSDKCNCKLNDCN
jgi:hypothetical protein